MNAVATLPKARSLVERTADRFGVDAGKLLTTLKSTAFRQKPGTEISNEQMMALLVVADQYELNPFTKEIYAFEDRGAIVPIVSVDGWARIINSHPKLDGVEFTYADEIETPQSGKPCPVWCEVSIHRKDRSRPTVVREYLDEVYRPPFSGGKAGPWQTHTKRFLRHKTLIQGSRVAFGFAGIYDPDEGDRILEATRVTRPERPADEVASLEAKLIERSKAQAPAGVDTETGEVIDVEVTEVPDPDHKPFLGKLHLAASQDELDAVMDAARAELPRGPGLDEVALLYDQRSLDLVA